MNITQNTPDLLVLRFTRWKGPLFWGAISLIALAVGGLMASDTDIGLKPLLIWLGLTITWMIPLALFLAERSMLTLNAATGDAQLSHRTIRGYHRQSWPLAEVQSTRITRREYANGPATKDPKRLISLYVREGMDEGRHKIAVRPVPATEALEASATISNWMKQWRERQS